MRRLVKAVQARHAEFPKESMEQLIDIIAQQEKCSRDDAGSAVAAVLAGEQVS